MDKNNRKVKILYKCIKANTNPIWQHNTHLLTAKTKIKQEPHKRGYLSKNWGFREKQFRRMGQKQKKVSKTERATGLGRRTRGDIEKWDQTDSPEISDRGETSGIPGLTSGELFTKTFNTKLKRCAMCSTCHPWRNTDFTGFWPWEDINTVHVFMNKPTWIRNQQGCLATCVISIQFSWRLSLSLTMAPLKHLCVYYIYAKVWDA